jgi:hypothetical protein
VTVVLGTQILAYAEGTNGVGPRPAAGWCYQGTCRTASRWRGVTATNPLGPLRHPLLEVLLAQRDSQRGYLGFEQGGLLVDAIRQHPYSVLLLDEIEKAHPDIFNILLQVMDHATLTDNNGRKPDFRQVVLILTSNAGSREMSAGTMGLRHRRHRGRRQEGRQEPRQGSD